MMSTETYTFKNDYAYDSETTIGVIALNFTVNSCEIYYIYIEQN